MITLGTQIKYEYKVLLVNVGYKRSHYRFYFSHYNNATISLKTSKVVSVETTCKSYETRLAVACNDGPFWFLECSCCDLNVCSYVVVQENDYCFYPTAPDGGYVFTMNLYMPFL